MYVYVRGQSEVRNHICVLVSSVAFSDWADIFFSKWLGWFRKPLKTSGRPNGVCGRSVILVIGLKDGGGGGGQKCACADFLSGDRPKSLSGTIHK